MPVPTINVFQPFGVGAPDILTFFANVQPVSTLYHDGPLTPVDNVHGWTVNPAASSGAATTTAPFIGAGIFTHTAGELRYATIGNTVLLGGDVDGDGAADFHIKLLGINTISAIDLRP